MDKFNLRNIPSTQGINKHNTSVPLDCPQWSRAGMLSLANLENLIRPTLDVNFIVDDETLILAPSTLKISVKHKIFLNEYEENDSIEPITPMNKGFNITYDVNFLYVWIESLNKWKRIALSDF